LKGFLSQKPRRWATYTELAGFCSQSCCTMDLSNSCLPSIDCCDNLAKGSSMNLVCICYKVDLVAAPSDPRSYTFRLRLNKVQSSYHRGTLITYNIRVCHPSQRGRLSSFFSSSHMDETTLLWCKTLNCRADRPWGGGLLAWKRWTQGYHE
jgi:hypothetical protein